MADTFSPKAKLNADSRIILVRVKIERAKKHLKVDPIVKTIFRPQ